MLLHCNCTKLAIFQDFQTCSGEAVFCGHCTSVHDVLIGRWCTVFRFEWKLRNQQECAEWELVQRSGWISEISDLIDWLNAASVKVRAAPAIGSSVDGKTVQLLVGEHKVEPSFSFNSFI